MRTQLTSWFTRRICFTFLIPLLIIILLVIYVRKMPTYSQPKSIFIASTLPDLPKHVLEKKASMKPYVSFIGVQVKGEVVITKVVEVPPPSGWKELFLFLHGMSYTSETWEKLGSLQLVAALGHRAIAVDLPGWGESANWPADKKINNADYIHSLLKLFNVTKAIIVTPSMSGSYSIPYMMTPSPSTCTDRLRGIITIAPTKTELFEHAQYFQCQLPALVVFGSKDKNLGLVSLSNLRNMPNKEIWEVTGAGHPAYLDKPQDWNKLLYYYALKFKN